MILLILGSALWFVSHSFKRVAPGARAKMGDKAKGPVALATFAAIILMVIGYRMSDGGAVLWGRSPALTGINNLLMLASFYLFAASGMKTWATSKIRHPQLMGASLWAVAHLLVNGDVASFILFGSILVWALMMMGLTNSQQSWTRPTGPFAPRKEAMAVVGGLIVFGVAVGIHYLLGYPTFG